MRKLDGETFDSIWEMIRFILLLPVAVVFWIIIIVSLTFFILLNLTLPKEERIRL